VIERSVRREYLSMTEGEVGQRGGCMVKTVESYNDGRERDWIFIYTGELVMLIGGYPI
jgi:hypothetical protein